MRVSILKFSGLIVFTGYALLGASQLMAAGYGAAGCGLGSVVFGSKPGFIQIFASTTNDSSWTQTFGITSGTSNCVSSGQAAAFNSQRDFINNNIAELAKEAAQGSGETLRAFTSTLGCSADAFGDIAKELQAKHQEIFAAPGADQVLFATHNVLQNSPVAASNCKKLI